MAVTLLTLELAASNGAALLAADDDFFYTDTAVTTGADQDITGSLAATDALYARTVTADLTDANSSITGLKIWLTGTDVAGRVISETLTFAGAGTEQVESVLAFRTLTSVIYHADGTSTPDTLKIGYGNGLAIPRFIEDIEEVEYAFLSDGTSYDPATGGGTFVVQPSGSTSISTWEPVGGKVPNGALKYYVQMVVDF